MARNGKKTGGRKKGTPNKDTAEAQRLCEELGIDPFKILLLFADNRWEELGYDSPTETRMVAGGGSFEVDKISVESRIAAAKEATKYVRPALKQVDATLSNKDGSKIEPVRVMTPEELIAYVQVARTVK